MGFILVFSAGESTLTYSHVHFVDYSLAQKNGHVKIKTASVKLY